jgi:lipopolysaccharide biosynthesis glycosyltransferase
MKDKETTGIYCLANDAVLDWTIAFFESLRTYEPNCRLIVIPFDDRISKLSQLAQKYNLEFFPNSENILEKLDDLGAVFNPKRGNNIHMFRKLAIFFGPLEHFLFLDSDIVVLSKLNELFEAYFASQNEFMYYKGETFDPVYKPGEFREKMIAEYSANGFNSGSFISSKGIFSLEDFFEISKQVTLLKEHFASYGEQSFLNYCVDIKRLKTKAFIDEIPDLASCWAKFEPIEKKGDKYSLFSKRLLFIHWAGFKPNTFMPNRKIFLDFRLKSESWLYRLQVYISDRVNKILKKNKN